MTTRSPRLILLTTLALLAATAAWLYFRPFSPRVIQVIPQHQSQNLSLDTQILATFDRPLTPRQQQTARITTQPYVAGQTSYQPPTNQLTFHPHTDFQPHTIYTITISASGLRQYTSIFTTRSGPTSLQQILQQAPQLTQQEQLLVNNLPYYGDNFMIQYIRLDHSFYISIWDEPIDSTRQAALQHIKSFGFTEPENQLNIRYNIPRTTSGQVILPY
jgi:hypothetical protein